MTCCFTETKSKRTDHYRVPGYDTYMENGYNQGEERAGRVAIFIKKYMRRQEIKLDNVKHNVDTLGLRVEGEKITINFICLYRRPSKTVKKGAWKNLSKDMDKKEIVVVADFNSHHTIWNCEVTDKNGEILLEEVKDQNLFIVNCDTV